LTYGRDGRNVSDMELVLKNLVTGTVSRIDRQAGDREMLQRIARMRNEREGREFKNVRWTVRG
jgi:hypothetical protein